MILYLRNISPSLTFLLLSTVLLKKHSKRLFPRSGKGLANRDLSSIGASEMQVERDTSMSQLTAGERHKSR